MQRSARLPLWFLFANWLLVVAAFALGVHLARRPTLPEPQQTALHLVHQEILRSHVDAQDPAALLDRAIGAMVGELDEYSQYVPPRAVAKFVEDTTGTYEGIGVLTHREQPTEGDQPARLFVRFPFPDGPGERAGLRPGDEIVAVDGVRVATLTGGDSARVDARIRGPAGSTVRLTIARDNEGSKELSVVRGPVHKPSVKWARLLDAGAGLGYVHVAEFHPGVTAELTSAIARLDAEAHGLRGLIVDLRFDGGGSLDECVDMARMFQPTGNILTMRRRGSEVVERHDADPARCRFPDLPLVLLVNENSASASEVLAGALQDHRRTTVVGTRTFGKGFVNTVFTYKDLDFRLKLTTAYYYTPNGRNLENLDRRRGKSTRLVVGESCPLCGMLMVRRQEGGDGNGRGGIVPDRVVNVTEEQALAIKTALADFEVPAVWLEAVTAWSLQHRQPLPGILAPAQDPQLAAALTALRARATAGGK